MTPRDRRQSNPAGQTGDDFQKIAGIGQAIERRLHDAGILTYQDLSARSPEQIAASLTDVAGLSSARIASQDWAGQAGRLAGPSASPLPSEPDQTYASFHIELLLDVDGSVRRTKVHHLQSGQDEAWPGWMKAADRTAERPRTALGSAAAGRGSRAVGRGSRSAIISHAYHGPAGSGGTLRK